MHVVRSPASSAQLYDSHHKFTRIEAYCILCGWAGGRADLLIKMNYLM